MPATSLNIKVDLPKGYRFNLEDLEHQVSLYAQFVVNQSKPNVKSKTPSSLLSLRGLLKTSKSDKELLDEYFQKKYGL